MPKIFITGANGFVGKNLIQELEKRKISFLAGVRKSTKSKEVSYGDIQTQSNWEEILKDCDCIVHLAARVHVMNETADDPMTLFRTINVHATLKLAEAAKKIGVKKFIYISSIKVNGEFTTTKPFSASDKPAPEDPYGLSKWEAEQAVMGLHEDGNFDVVIIRPPLIYGPGVKANFEKLFKLVEMGLPLPFGAVNNKRSMVSVYNLCDLIIRCVENPSAGGKTFLVSDDQDLSLKDLIINMGKAKNKKPFLLPIPASLMKLALDLIGKKSFSIRLLGNLQVDIQDTKKVLNWKPPCTFVETMKN